MRDDRKAKRCAVARLDFGETEQIRRAASGKYKSGDQVSATAFDIIRALELADENATIKSQLGWKH